MHRLDKAEDKHRTDSYINTGHFNASESIGIDIAHKLTDPQGQRRKYALIKLDEQSIAMRLQ